MADPKPTDRLGQLADALDENAQALEWLAALAEDELGPDDPKVQAIHDRIDALHDVAEFDRKIVELSVGGMSSTEIKAALTAVLEDFI